MRNLYIFVGLLRHMHKITKTSRENYLNRGRSYTAVTLRDTNLVYNNGPYQADRP